MAGRRCSTPTRAASSPHPEDEVQGATVVDGTRPLCDCDEPCDCYVEGYAAGKGKEYFEVIVSLEGPPHTEG